MRIWIYLIVACCYGSRLQTVLKDFKPLKFWMGSENSQNCHFRTVRSSEHFLHIFRWFGRARRSNVALGLVVFSIHCSTLTRNTHSLFSLHRHQPPHFLSWPLSSTTFSLYDFLCYFFSTPISPLFSPTRTPTILPSSF